MEHDAAYARERLWMVEQQIERRGIHDERLLEVMRNVPRHLFVPQQQRSLAYEDFPLRIGRGQTISQPYIVALMTELLQLKGDEVVLEVGTGSGYQAAVLAGLAQTVHSVERIPELAENARKTLEALNVQNAHVHVGDGSLGWIENAPYGAILVTAAAPRVPRVLLEQLTDEGLLVLPVGDHFMQELQIWQRHAADYDCRHNIAVAFVPLRGEYGWKENEWDW